MAATTETSTTTTTTTPTSDEKAFIEKNIHKLKSHFAECYVDQVPIKILENVGEHPYVIKFTQNGVNITLQIQSDYSLPHSLLIINASKVDATKIAALTSSLEATKAKDDQYKHSDNALVELFTLASEYIDDHVADATTTTTTTNSKPSKKDKSSNRAAKKSDNNGTENGSSPVKKKPMKTAGDVVHRIQWDTAINKDHIIVGYMDRFLGLRECLFTTFDWGDIVLADLGALAIPEHRINYFKYKARVIWDKNIRLDDVFGSTGSHLTIHDIIRDMADVAYVPSLPHDDEEVNKVGRANKSSSHYDAAPKKDEPNYFVAMPIGNADIRANIRRLGDRLLASDAGLAAFVVPTDSLHLTVCTLRVDDLDELERVKAVLDGLLSDERFATEHFPVAVRCVGLGDFYDKVLYARCEVERVERLRRVKDAILERLVAAGVSTAGNYYDFTPHLTVMKISGTTARSYGDVNATVSGVVDEEIMDAYRGFCFGEDTVSQLVLCKMGNIFSLGTYPVEHTVDFGK